MNKKGFTLLEILFIILLLLIITAYINLNQPINKLDLATKRLALYLKETRYIALIDDKYNHEDPLWHKMRWTLKFFRCNKNIGGIYYIVYTDKNKKGHPNVDEALDDPLTKRKIFTTNQCTETSNHSKYVLLTKEFDIVDIDITCNETSGLGQISFGSDGRVYSKLSSNEGEFYEYEIEKKCIIKLLDKKGEEKSIEVLPKTGYILKKEKRENRKGGKNSKI
jgi:Tfp pilus assembly protein FimT